MTFLQHVSPRGSVRNRVLRPAASLLAGLVTVGLLSGALASEPGKPGAKGRAATLKAPMALHWKFTGIPYVYNPASPTVADGVVYFASGSRVFAVDLASGGLKWQYPKDSFLSSPVVATPVVSNGVLYFSAGDGPHALNVADGSPRWQPISLKAGVVTSPVVLADKVLFGTGDNRVLAINIADGKPTAGVWAPGNVAGVSASGDFTGDLVAAGDVLYYVTGDQNLRAMSLTTASQRWATRLNANFRSATPVISNDVLYLAAGTTLASFRANNGQPRWNVNLPADAAAPPVVDSTGNTYIVTSDRTVYALDIRGRGFWKQAFKLDNEVIAAPVVSGSLLIVGTSLGGVYALDTATGTLKWHYSIQPSSRVNDAIPLTTNVSAAPVVVDDTLLVLTDDGTLNAFRADAPDNAPPVVTRLEPEQGDYINGLPPMRFSAKIVDEGSGLQLDSLALMLDDKQVPRRPDRDSDKNGFVYDADNGILEYLIFDSTSGVTQGFADGPHTVTLMAKDWMGNALKKQWVFHTDNTLPRRRKKDPNQPNGGPGGTSGKGRPGGLGGPGGGPGGFGGGGGS